MWMLGCIVGFQSCLYWTFAYMTNDWIYGKNIRETISCPAKPKLNCFLVGSVLKQNLKDCISYLLSMSIKNLNNKNTELRGKFKTSPLSNAKSKYGI